MSFRSWLSHPPIGVGIIVAVALFGAAYLNVENDKKQHADTSKPSSTQQQATTNAPRLPSDGEKTVDPDWSNPKCANPQNHDEADLCQQIRMAKAAEQTVTLNQVQVAIGVVGGFLLFLTLFYSRKAAIAASDAAKAANETADAMMDAERPHMFASEIKITGLAQPPEADGTVKLKVLYRFTNYGRSPALLKRFSASAVFQEALVPIPTYSAPIQLRFTVPVNGWYGTVEPTDMPRLADDVLKVHLGTFDVWVFGLLEYEDAFGKGHRNRFAYMMVCEGDATTAFRPDGPDSYHEYT